MASSAAWAWSRASSALHAPNSARSHALPSGRRERSSRSRCLYSMFSVSRSLNPSSPIGSWVSSSGT